MTTFMNRYTGKVITVTVIKEERLSPNVTKWTTGDGRKLYSTDYIRIA